MLMAGGSLNLSNLQGVSHDVRPLWALADAERYGAETVFLSLEMKRENRQVMMSDLEAGLNPVIHSTTEVMALAA